MMPYTIVLILLASAVSGKADNDCAARKIPGQSVVCVCNATYCDEVIRETPVPEKFVYYTSSEAGSRFKKTIKDFSSGDSGSCVITLTLNPKTTYQTVEGFGGAVTDAAGINWKNLTDANLQQKVIDSYFGENGLQYNMLRVPIGGTDFSTRPYAYNEQPRDDAQLSNYTLAFEDYEYKIPMIKAILAAATAPIHIVSTTWSPPPWMKTNDKITGFSRLKPEYFQTYAEYHYKFLEKYAAEGISIWGITTTNEPINGVFNLASFNTLGWTPGMMGQWIANNLGPTIRNSTFKDLKILTLDDQRVTIPFWFNLLNTFSGFIWTMLSSSMIQKHPEALKYIDGVAVHYYTDKIIPASVLSFISRSYPDKFILATEACEGSAPWDKEKVILGSWQRAKNYITDIIQDMNYNVVGWIDWNLCLNHQGGPNWVKNFVDSPIIVFPEKKEFIKQPMFYAVGHFSKFVPRGSRRIDVVAKKSFWTGGVDNLAFLTPNNTVVVVLYNDADARKICLKLGKKTAVVTVEARSVVTVELPLEQ